MVSSSDAWAGGAARRATRSAVPAKSLQSGPERPYRIISFAFLRDPLHHKGSKRLPDTIIELDSVKLSLPSAAGTVNILRGIDLSIAKGETAGLVGPSGSGKSTLLMVLA